MIAIPRLSPAAFIPDGTLRTNGFTIGKAYRVRRREGNCGVVVNDNGHDRTIFLDGSPCAHIVSIYSTDRNWPRQFVVGYFEILKEANE